MSTSWPTWERVDQNGYELTDWPIEHELTKMTSTNLTLMYAWCTILLKETVSDTQNVLYLGIRCSWRKWAWFCRRSPIFFFFFFLHRIDACQTLIGTLIHTKLMYVIWMLPWFFRSAAKNSWEINKQRFISWQNRHVLQWQLVYCLSWLLGHLLHPFSEHQFLVDRVQHPRKLLHQIFEHVNT